MSKTATQAQVAARFGVTQTTIQKMLKRGALTEGPARVPTVLLDSKYRNELNRWRRFHQTGS